MAQLNVHPQKIIDRVRTLDGLKQQYGLKILFCVKSLSHAETYGLVSSVFDGIEISNDRELFDPAAPLKVVNTLDEKEIDRLPLDDSYLVSVENRDMYDGFRYAPYLLRLNSTGWLGPDILKQNDLKGSRFGLDEDDVDTAMIDGAQFRGIHFHFGRFIDHSKNIHRRFLDKVHNRFGSDIPIIDIGGGQHRIDDLDEIIAYAKERFPNAELYIEPGRWISQGCVFADAEVIRAEKRADYVDLVLDLSNEIHCRWADEIFPRPAYHGGQTAKLSGPTCFEADQFGVHDLDPAFCEKGARIELGGLTGYCISLNQTFNGIAPASVAIC